MHQQPYLSFYRDAVAARYVEVHTECFGVQGHSRRMGQGCIRKDELSPDVGAGKAYLSGCREALVAVDVLPDGELVSYQCLPLTVHKVAPLSQNVPPILALASMTSPSAVKLSLHHMLWPTESPSAISARPVRVCEGCTAEVEGSADLRAENVHLALRGEPIPAEHVFLSPKPSGSECVSIAANELGLPEADLRADMCAVQAYLTLRRQPDARQLPRDADIFGIQRRALRVGDIRSVEAESRRIARRSEQPLR